MLEPVFQTLEKLFLEFSWRRLVLVLFIAALSIGVFVAFERYTSYFELGRLERATQILEQLKQLKADEKLAADENLASIHSKLVGELSLAVSDRSFSFYVDYRFYKFLAGAAPWIFLSFFYIAGFAKRDKTKSTGVIAAIFFGLVFGSIGLLIPELLWPWLNFAIYPIVHFVLFMAIMTAGRETQKASTR